VTAAVTFGGKTFRFGNGECTVGPGFTVNIGTLVLGSTSKARPYFGFFLTSGRAGVHSGKQAAVSFAASPASRVRSASCALLTTASSCSCSGRSSSRRARATARCGRSSPASECHSNG